MLTIDVLEGKEGNGSAIKALTPPPPSLMAVGKKVWKKFFFP